MQTDSMSFRRGLGHLRHPCLEQRPRVVRPGASLGVELERARAQVRQVEALHRPVVERDVRDLGCLPRRDREAVVLARHEHAAREPLVHRMVRTSMAERKLVRVVAGGARDQLVAEADAEHVRAAEQLPHRLGLRGERLGVARPR
jgi:hypothetical protein